MQQTDNEIIIAIVAATIMFVLLGLFIFNFIFLYKKKQMAHVNEKNLLTIQFQQELLQTQLEIQEQTLKNISQEIHDNIGQTLSLVKLNLNTIDLQKENAGDKIVNSKELVSKAIHDLRNLSKSLNTDSILASGLIKGIETELSVIDHSGNFKTELQLHGQAVRIDSKKELILFRIVQESLNNIIKHSNTNIILVKLDFTDAHLKIEVCDNGKGFDVNPEGSEGQGLRNMKSRAELIGGNFNVTSNSNGTTITITLPITAS